MTGTRVAAALAVLAVVAAPAPALAETAPDGPVTLTTTAVVDGRPSVRSITADTPAEVAAAKAQLAALPGDAPVEEARPLRAFAGPDPYRLDQWHLDALATETLDPALTAASGQVVAVLDTGVQAAHPELGSTRVLCAQGADFSRGTKDTSGAYVSTGNGCVDGNGHGTHVAGVIAAATADGQGVHGMTRARVLPVKVLTDAGSGSTDTTAVGVRWAVDHGATVINMSLGSEYFSQVLEDALAYATSRNVLVVASAGNNRAPGARANWPGASVHALGVAASDEDHRSASFSYSGPTNDITAPGTDILSLDTPDSYSFMSGTSMAAPMVAAGAAMYRSLHTSATPTVVMKAVTDAARDLEAPGFDHNTGHGLLDVRRLLTGARLAAPARPAVTAELVDRDVVVRYEPVASTAAAPVRGYRVLRDWLVVDTVEVSGTVPSVLTWTDVRPPAGSWADYAVAAYGDGGRTLSEAVSVDVPFDLPATPPALTAATTDGTVTLRWQPSPDTASAPVDGYRVSRDGRVVATRTTTSFTDSGLVVGASHTYSVVAYNSTGESGRVTTAVRVAGAPPAPAPAPYVPAPVADPAPAPSAPAPAPAVTAPPAPAAPAATAPAPVAPAPVVPPVVPAPLVVAPVAPAPRAPATAAPAPRPTTAAPRPSVSTPASSVARAGRLPVAARGLAPGSVVTVTARYQEQVRTRVRGRVVTRTVTREVTLGTARVDRAGSATLAVRPPQQRLVGGRMRVLLTGTGPTGTRVTSSALVAVR